uniref:ADP-ribosyl cyclase/cyclic ADP-ribose hydrolase n=1 Tax=Quercus lobata TaxID=97700 RepID=A0A7N2MS11_QUELO
MPSWSLRTTPCTCSKYEYDVFISFRGEDTRTRFTDHLCKAFKDKRIRVYRDDSDLERGKTIWTELVQAIKTSRIAVIVFSENYANSKWCLDELVAIMDCKSSTSKRRCKCKETLTVLPIFYHVSPSEVREQKGNFAEALPKGPKKKWREALTESAKLSGFPLTKDSSESKYIEQIVETISKTLNRESLSAAPAGSESNIHREDSSGCG